MDALEKESRRKGDKYILQSTSVWVQVETLHICIQKGDKGVRVDIYSKDETASGPLDTAWALFKEGE